MRMIETPVLIVGGSLVGLSASVFLAARGVPTVLVERHPGSSAHPRAIGYTPRTLETYRSVGLAPLIPQVPPDLKLRRIRVASLAGEWFEESSWTPGSDDAPRREYSPCTGAAIAQDLLEPILRARAVELGADLRLQNELLGFEQDEEGVTACVRGPNGEEFDVRAQYMVAADGSRSPIREALGIGRDGRGFMAVSRSVLFRAPLEEYRASGFGQFTIDQPDFKAFLTTYGDGRWVLFLRDDRDHDEQTLRTFIERAIGRSDLPVEILTTGRWETSALIADRFSSGRVFLAGDAAHTLPPNRGGFGANTGIEDADNLAWKLAEVLAGRSTPRLLDTYDAERRPIAWLRHQQIFARDDFKEMAGGTAEGTTILDDAAMEFGQLYRSSAVLGADEKLPPAARPETWAGQPGTRAPHVWVTRDGERVSTLDLFRRGWVLVAEDERWHSAAKLVGERLGLPFGSVRLGVDVRTATGDDELHTTFGLTRSGASLVRPDGYIAWRSVEMALDPALALAEALGTVAATTTRPA